jgi:ATP-dependent DNA helicase RecQ
MQLQAGYIFDFVKNKLLSENKSSEVLALLESLSYFEVDSTLTETNPNGKPELAVLNNLLSRGLPTRPSLFIENIFLKSLAIGETIPDTLGNIESLTDNSFNSIAQYLFKALHITDPRVIPDRTKFQIQQSFEFDNIGSRYEEDFLFSHVPEILGAEWFQLLESQREFTSIVNFDNNFTRQRSDFSIEFPFHINDKKGIVVEIDGSHHWENQNQRILDEQRDKAVTEAGWQNTLRIKTTSFDRIENHFSILKELAKQPYFQIIKQNYQAPLHFNRDGIKALQLILSPFAIARIQKVLTQNLLQGKLSLTEAKWKVAIIERDVPCAAIAIADLKQQLQHIFALQDKTFLPEIELTVFTTQEFQSAFLNKIELAEHFASIQFLDLTNASANNAFDILIDISVLQRNGFSGNEIMIQASEKCVVRSAHHKHTTRTFLTSDIITYSNFVTTNEQQNEQTSVDDSKVRLLEYFLQNIFRKEKFRAGQLEILNKALQGQSVIGLLPTGGGKSLTYQLAALLQPGICLVIDPIKSLMKDQFDNLQKNQIDACNFINSSLKTRKQKTRETGKLKNAEVLISFVSPERLQMREFRDILKIMKEEEIYFNYCVIDEAHCVSEWGHDFRTSYLSLGKNAIEFCRTKNKESIPLFGLTATASFDVLSDIQRELSGNNERNKLKEDSIIRFDTVNREELSFEIVDVHADLQDTDSEWTLKEKLGKQKQSKLINHLRTFRFDNQNKFSGIIFCPHRGWYFGVTDRYRKDDKRNAVYDSIQRAAIPSIRMGTFMGSESDDERTAELIEADSILAQEEFIDNKLNLLVSTKAFGMGIDKPNIRFTFHLNYTSSIESFVQEAGRAGRDKKQATSYILFNDERVEKGEKVYEIDRDNLLFFHNSSFKGVEKEKAILFELLTAIHTPNKLFEIEVKLFEEFQQDINLSLWQSQRGYWYLFVNGEKFEDKFGAIRIPSLEVDTARITKPVTECNRVLNFISNFIRQNVNGQITSWLKTSTTIAGLETLLQANERIELTLRFENNITERIEVLSKWLNAAFNTSVFDLVKTKGILASSNSFEDFKEQVVSKLNNGRTFEQTAQKRDIARGNRLGTATRELQRLFDGYRIKADTEKALYRLSTVGVIDDYTVDFNSKTYTVYARRKTDEQYFKNLENFIRKYYSEVRTKKEIKAAWTFEGETTIQKCLFFLTDFVYREIEKKRFEGIGVMKDACEIGKENGGVAFKEFVDLYFNSKYSRKGYEVDGENKSLTDRTEDGRQQKIDWVWEFIQVIDEDKSGGHINNLKHLRGACVRLLIPQPDNATFHLLKAFSIFILEPENKRLMEEASNSFAKGFIEFQKENNWTFDWVLIEAENFKNFVLEFSTHPNILEIMQNQITILSVKVHSEWLENFNNKFLEKYEPRHSYAP